MKYIYNEDVNAVRIALVDAARVYRLNCNATISDDDLCSLFLAVLARNGLDAVNIQHDQELYDGIRRQFGQR